MEPEKQRAILFYDLCRLCLENAGVNDTITTTNLVRDIFLCTGVHVDSEDNLPRKICHQCLEIVVQAKRLRVLAVANETHLKSLFDDNETFIIGPFNKTDQSQIERNTISRKSSTDSDRTVKLEIVENFNNCPEEKIQSGKRKTSNSSDQSETEVKKKISVRNDLFDSSAAVHQTEEKKIIKVRNDLFDSAAAVTSSTKEVNTPSLKQNLKVKIKRFKTETGDCFHYVCGVCQKKFSAWKKYYLHQKTHNRHIICPLDTCGKKFASKGDLEKHVRTHTGERPYSCNLCDKRFSQRGTLKSHKLTVHAESGSPEKS